jgi:hypothetical protein
MLAYEEVFINKYSVLSSCNGISVPFAMGIAVWAYRTSDTARYRANL